MEGMFTELGPFTLDLDSLSNATAGGVPTLQRNPHGWTAAASMLFWEAPAGVGFSYCDGAQGLCPHWNDTTTAVDNANFLCEFFALYPEFADRFEQPPFRPAIPPRLPAALSRPRHRGSRARTGRERTDLTNAARWGAAGRDFYLTGESYAGVYIPTVTLELMKRTCPRPVNLKGMAIGNGCTGTVTPSLNALPRTRVE